MNKDELNNILVKKKIQEHKLWLNSNGKEGKRADLRGANLIDADLTGADLRCANLIDADLSDANLIGTELRYANLTGADLRWTALTSANLMWVHLEGSNIEKCIGKKVVKIKGPQHTIYYIDGNVHIGCQCGPVEWWIESGKRLGLANSYLEEEIEWYLNEIKKLAGD